MHESRETSGYFLNSRTCRTNVSFVAKKKGGGMGVKGGGGGGHYQGLRRVANPGKKVPHKII